MTMIASGAAVDIDCGANIGLTSVWFARRFLKLRLSLLSPKIELRNCIQKCCVSNVGLVHGACGIRPPISPSS
jgi:hypothetical protein